MQYQLGVHQQAETLERAYQLFGLLHHSVTATGCALGCTLLHTLATDLCMSAVLGIICKGPAAAAPMPSDAAEAGQAAEAAALAAAAAAAMLCCWCCMAMKRLRGSPLDAVACRASVIWVGVLLQQQSQAAVSTCTSKHQISTAVAGPDVGGKIQPRPVV